MAFLLGLLSAVLPAFAVAKKELWEKPSQLLLPKPPRAGAKIVLERITPLWKRLSFTEKVTMRNIFRYKQRMFMTLFGVAGSIALLFAGLGIRSSVSNLNQQQFEDIIHYDMIVAKQPNTSSALDEELTKLLDSKDVKEYLNVHFETLQKLPVATRTLKKSQPLSLTTVTINSLIVTLACMTETVIRLSSYLMTELLSLKKWQNS